jgi:hypothetical protein
MIVTRRSQLKKDLIDLLKQEEASGLFPAFQRYDDRILVNILFPALCHQQELVRWHAVTVFGWTADRIASRNLEAARIIMRRLLWSLNDESGGIGWGAPEAMAEIMAQNDVLFAEYLHMLLSYMREDGPEPFQDGNYLELPQLQRGVVWGVGRLAIQHKDILRAKGAIDDVIPYLRSPDAPVRGLSVWSLGLLGAVPAREGIQRLLHDEGHVSVYYKGKIIETTVSELAQQALESFV